MPLARYFSYVGGVLLALLFVLDAYLPKTSGRVKGHMPICLSSVFIPTGNGRSALFSIPAFRR